MDPKQRPNQAIYLEALRKMGPEGRLQKAMELSDLTNQMFWVGLRRRFPSMEADALRQMGLEWLARCHNRNY